MTIFAQGTPKGQPRVRAFVRGRHAGVYDPGTADDWKALITIASRQKIQALNVTTFPIFNGPVTVTSTFIFPRPKAHFRSNGALKTGAPHYHTAKPDRDNCDKAVLDALTHLQFWPDDSYAAAGTIIKRYANVGEATGVLIQISPL